MPGQPVAVPGQEAQAPTLDGASTTQPAALPPCSAAEPARGGGSGGSGRLPHRGCNEARQGAHGLGVWRPVPAGCLSDAAVNCCLLCWEAHTWAQPSPLLLHKRGTAPIDLWGSRPQLVALPTRRVQYRKSVQSLVPPHPCFLCQSCAALSRCHVQDNPHLGSRHEPSGGPPAEPGRQCSRWRNRCSSSGGGGSGGSGGALWGGSSCSSCSSGQ